jgi:TIR domain
MEGERYDVFVSYNRRDAPLAREVVSGLKDAGFRVWIDEERIQPGDPWADVVMRGIEASRATVLLIGRKGVTSWMKKETENAFRARTNRDHRIIPVLLKDAPEDFLTAPEPGFLSDYQFVNCREFSIAKNIVSRVAAAIAGRQQIEGEFPVTLRRPDGSERVIRVFTIPSPEPNRRLRLTWETFGACIERLGQQLANYGYRITGSACIGINDAGLAMATFLGSAYLDRPPFGYIRCAGNPDRPGYIRDDSLLPDLGERPSILLVDSQVKTGRGLAAVCRRLRERYTDPEIYFATCVVMVRNGLTFQSIEELETHQNLRDAGIVDVFIAATMNPPGVDPPLGLR